MTIKFDYEPWDDKNDRLLDRPITDIAVAAVNSSLQVGDMPYARQHDPDLLIREVESGAIRMLAGTLEYLRSRGLSTAQVENKVRAYLRDHKDGQRYTVLSGRAVLLADGISNPDNSPLQDTVVTV